MSFIKAVLRYRILVPFALLLGTAPYFHEPHIVEKIRMLMSGTLHKPIDIFDLFLHSLPLILLGFKAGSDLARLILSRKTPR